MTTRPLLAALLDIDGTLLDSNDAHARAWVDAFARIGRPQSFDRVRPLIGKGADKMLAELLGADEGDSAGHAASTEYADRFRDHYLASLQPTTGARQLLMRLRAEGWKLVVTTSAGEKEVDALLRQAGVAELVDMVTTSSEADHSKPDPDIVMAALDKAAVGPDRALMLGDTPYDIEAARKAGVGTVALRCGGFWDDEAFSGALAIYDDPAALLAKWAASPFGVASTAY